MYGSLTGVQQNNPNPTPQPQPDSTGVTPTLTIPASKPLLRTQSMLADTSYQIPYEEIVIDKQIGKGAFGIVYLGKWRSSKVAVKKIIDENAKSLEEFEAEGQIMTRLRPHKNVVLFLGVCIDPMCLVTEFVEKGSLSVYILSDAEIPMNLSVKWIKGIAAGMLHLHSEKLIHRDLAARNVLLAQDYTPKIADFGLSRENKNESSSNTTKSDSGPLKWMAPESINSRVYSRETDVWAYGVLMFEILNRSEPYPGLDPVQAASRVVFQGLIPDIPQDAPQQVQEIMKQCFTTAPSGRPNFEVICERFEELDEYKSGTLRGKNENK